MNRFLLFNLLLLAGLRGVEAQKVQRFNEKDLHVTWQLLTTDFQNADKSIAALTLHNQGKKLFPASGWTLYFNSVREIEAEGVTGGVAINHVNGDLFKMTPTAAFNAIPPKEAKRIEFFSGGRTLNATGAPSGLYLVWDNDPNQGYSIANYTITPLKYQVAGLATPEKVFRQNSIVQDIPAAELPKIFPTPVNYKALSGEFLLSAGMIIQSDVLFKNEAEYLSEALGKRFGSNNQIVYGGETGKIRLLKADMPPEAYQLSVSSQGISITAGSGSGIFYGIQSLWSLMPATAWNGIQVTAISIPAVEVQDAPRFGYRSLMLDVARNFKSKKDIFRVLDLMALYKMNVFHLHFSEDEGWRIEIPSLPELTEVGAKRGHTAEGKTMLPPSYGSGPLPNQNMGSGFYTKADFIEILKYAHRRHISVIPEIETPGHGRAAIKAMDARYEKYMRQGKKQEAEQYLLRDIHDESVYRSAQLWTDNVMCVALPSVYAFTEKVVDELMAMYKEAGVPLTTIHMGGDEVPAGAWEKSPACRQLIEQDPNLHETDDLWYYYYGRINAMLKSKGLFMSAWEEAGMRKTMRDGAKTMIVNPRFANNDMQLHVWNNVTGWGAEDLPYRLANAGYKVVLSPVSNNYLDLAYCIHPEEPGYYWGGFQDVDKPFYFIPFDYYKTSKEGPGGDPVDPAIFECKERLTDFGRSNIVGIQGLLWNENIRSIELMDYMLLPKILGVAERAWAKEPDWSVKKDDPEFEKLYNKAWSVFANVLGKRELPRLTYFGGGFNYRIPPAGAVVEDGKVIVNLQLPGFTIRYTTDGTEPNPTSKLYTGPIADNGTVKIKVFDAKGRGGHTMVVENRKISKP
ncbi:MAG: carbohydate-binding domain-containing protein [Saprospiraceae bacterium]|nr:carbohydate-binding domain-containing protein [Saprospiraceae bacterium]